MGIEEEVWGGEVTPPTLKLRRATAEALKRLGAIAVAVIMATPSVHATGEAGAAGEFLNFGVGGRPVGMGKAFTGVSDDVDAVYWNPGGLATFRSGQATVQQTSLPGGASFQYLGLAQPIYTFGAIGVGVLNLSSGEVDRTDENFYKTGTFDSRETGYMLSYAHRLGERWGLGGTVKMVENSIDTESARGYGGDVGAMYMPNEWWRIGAMVRNASAPKYKYDTDTENFPRLARVGTSYRFLQGRLLAAVDVERNMGSVHTPDKWYAGLEGRVYENIAVRAGVNTDNITAGAGVGWRTFVMDYAAEYQELGFFHRLSLKMFFGGYEVDAKANPRVFSPIGLTRKTMITLSCRNRSRIVKWVVSIRNAKGVVVRSFRGYDTPPDGIEWDGTSSQGRAVDPGTYYYNFVVTDNRNRMERSPVRELRIVAPTPIELETK